MAMLVPGILFFFCCFASGYTINSNGSKLYGDHIQGSRAIVEETAQLSPRSSSGFGPLPDFLRVPVVRDFKNFFSPGGLTGPVPDEVTGILRATPAPVVPDPGLPLLGVVCLVDSFFVRVSRSLFTSRHASIFLRLGLCRVNRRSSNFYYFFYRPTSSCGFIQTEEPDFVSVAISLRYRPPGPVVFERPFHIDIRCLYHRIHHVYSAGIRPILLGGPVPVSLTSEIIAQIVPRDAEGNELTGTQIFTLGEPIFFEARLAGPQARAPASQRLYVNKCFISPSQDPNADPKYIVIDKLGCMLAGRITNQARFLPSVSRSSLSFSVSAPIFREMLVGPGTVTLYMHCEIVTGPLIATVTRKSCNPVFYGWRELYDSNEVCRCCRRSQSCGPDVRASNTLYASSALVVDADLEPTTKAAPIDDEEFLNYSESDLDY